MYRARTTLWHTGENRYVRPGDPVDLSHLDDAGVARLVATGAVEPIVEVAPRRAQRNQEEVS